MKPTPTTERYYWLWLWRIGIRTTRLTHWQAGLGFGLCIAYCLIYLYPVVLDQGTDTVIIVPKSQASLAQLELDIKDHASTVLAVQHVTGATLHQDLTFKVSTSQLSPIPDLPDVLRMTVRHSIFTKASRHALFAALSKNTHVDRIITSQNNKEQKILLQITLSLLLMLSLVGSVLWVLRLRQHLLHHLQTFLFTMFPSSLLASVSASYRWRLNLFLCLCLGPMGFMVLCMLTWLI